MKAVELRVVTTRELEVNFHTETTTGNLHSDQWHDLFDPRTSALVGLGVSTALPDRIRPTAAEKASRESQ